MRKGVAVLLAVVSIFALTTTGLAGGFEGYVTASTLYVREQPFSESDTIHFVRNGEKVSIIKKVNEWYHVSCANGIEGYVYAQFIRIEGTDSSSATGSKTVSAAANNTLSSKTASASLSAQTGVGSKATMVSDASLPSYTTIGAQGDSVSTIQQALDELGYNTGKIDGIFGPITYQAVKEFQKDNGLVVDGIVGKATISVLFSDVLTTKQAASPKGNQTAQGAAKIPTSVGSNAATTVSQTADKNQQASNTADVKTQTADNLGDKPSGQSSSTITATGSDTSVTSASASDTKTSEVSSAGTSVSASSVSSASNSASSGSKTKSLDWYSEGYSLINNNKNITVYDLNTGVVWNAKYINGKNHADIIPATSTDAKKIASGNITGSYVRRPVVVSIGGTNYAGSMYAVGHGETSYCDYFKGVMCIHFTGSQTHGTQKVDADHQKAIEVALKATVTR